MLISRLRLPSVVCVPLLVVLSLTSMAALPYSGAAREKKAEKPYALIFGTVWGPDSRPIYGVKVRIRRVDPKKAHWELYSDHRGEFAQRLPPGPADFVVGVDLKGYKSQRNSPLRLPEEVKVHIANDERQDIGLHLIY